MSLCKSGQIQNCCLPNALMTLKEYLIDYASPATRALGEKMIQQQIGEIARTLGFDDCAYFTRLFTKRTGMSPTSYREKYLG